MEFIDDDDVVVLGVQRLEPAPGVEGLDRGEDVIPAMGNVAADELLAEVSLP